MHQEVEVERIAQVVAACVPSGMPRAPSRDAPKGRVASAEQRYRPARDAPPLQWCLRACGCGGRGGGGAGVGVEGGRGSGGRGRAQI